MAFDKYVLIFFWGIIFRINFPMHSVDILWIYIFDTGSLRTSMYTLSIGKNWLLFTLLSNIWTAICFCYLSLFRRTDCLHIIYLKSQRLHFFIEFCVTIIQLWITIISFICWTYCNFKFRPFKCPIYLQNLDVTSWN